ncbi:MAG TPA: ATP-binding cassette domain-containing protein [Thermosynergistes sp.]|mgnify:CR=1 FL=1|nr:ATP-binding cassette domain-containing protein [Thermosynergistes sp.]HXK89517.1 ATP-binding cassette domain-containing protein [Thermosynergistes sp.]
MSIAVESVKYVYHSGTPVETVALDGVSLSVDRGEWVAVVGHTGSGKSTLAQHLNALLLPTKGSVFVDDIPAVSKGAQLKAIRRRVGLVFQYPEQQLFAESVFDEVAFAPRNFGVPEEELDKVVRSSLRLVGLDEGMVSRSPFSLSGGEQRRLAIASVLAARPSYIVLDEPTAGLDARGKKELVSLLRSFKEEGFGIVHITHDLDIALKLCDSVLVLEDGKSRFWGAPSVFVEQLIEHPPKGLVLPPLVELAWKLRQRGMDVPVTWDVERLFSAVTKEVSSCVSSSTSH